MNIVDRIISPNIWNEEWEIGSISEITGGNITNSNNIRSKNFIEVMPSSIYYKYGCNTNTLPYLRIFYYDANKNFVDYGGTYYRTFTTPANCKFIKLCTIGGYGNTYNHDICINESNPSINGKYFPYVMYKRYDMVDLYRKWNQFAAALTEAYWGTTFGTTTFNNGIATLTPTAKYGRLQYYFTYKPYHRLLLIASIKLSNPNIPEGNSISIGAYGIDYPVYGSQKCQPTTEWQTIKIIRYATSASSSNRLMVTDSRESNWGTVQIKDYMAVDLTDIYGAGNEPTTYEQFIADYPEFESYVQEGSGEWPGIIGNNANKIKRLKIGG